MIPLSTCVCCSTLCTQTSPCSHVILQRVGPAVSQRGLCICYVQENTSNIFHRLSPVVLHVPYLFGTTQSVRVVDIAWGAPSPSRCPLSCLRTQEFPQDQDPDDGDASADPQRFQETLRVLAETAALVAGPEGSGRRKLAQFRIEEHSGVGTAQEYKPVEEVGGPTQLLPRSLRHRTRSSHRGFGQGNCKGLCGRSTVLQNLD